MIVQDASVTVQRSSERTTRRQACETTEERSMTCAQEVSVVKSRGGQGGSRAQMVVKGRTVRPGRDYRSDGLAVPPPSSLPSPL